MAEIVGKNWGIHKFKTTAMFTKKEYMRSVEGSMCVYFACVFTILTVTQYLEPGVWNWFQELVAYIVLPPLMTAIEATAPHSWDNPLLLLGGGLVTFGIFFIPGGNPPPYADAFVYDYDSIGE